MTNTRERVGRTEGIRAVRTLLVTSFNKDA